MLFQLLSVGQCSTSSIELETHSATDSELRDGMLGGTVEADLDNRGLEMFPMDSKTNESSCPSWLRKVNLKRISAVMFSKTAR